MTNPNYTHLVVIADRSGSMTGIAKDMNGGIRTLLNEQSKLPGELHVDVVTFDTAIEFPYTDVRADDVKTDVIVPRGGTALNDAIGMTVVRLGEKFAAMPEDDRPGKVVVVVVTDGEENSSREYTAEQAKALVKKQTDEFDWTFIYLAANVDAFATGDQYSFGRGQTMSYGANSKGASNVFASASANISRGRMGGAYEFTDDERDEAEELKNTK